MLKRIVTYIRRLYYNINKKMFVPQARWLLSWVRKLSFGERWTGNRFWFLSKVGGVGDGERIEPQFFILFPEFGVDPILLSKIDICLWSRA